MMQGAFLRRFRRLRHNLCNYVLIWFLRGDKPSPFASALLIPLHEKDLPFFREHISTTLKNLVQPVDELVLVGTAKACAELDGFSVDGCAVRIIPEAQVLPADFSAQGFTDSEGKKRSGWITQQIIKLSWPAYIGSESCIVLDADTFINRPASYISAEGHYWLFTADDENPGWNSFVEKALGRPKQFPWSLVAHTMIFRRGAMAALQAHIEQRFNQPWLEALQSLVKDRADHFSEYELYGTFVCEHQDFGYRHRYFYNVKRTKKGTFLKGMRLRLSRFISNHVKTD
ncbi:Uncharacterised protein [Pannonibacter phragmitetus]|uniref:Glycosyl transferase n=1 Tax=Pannonibacter phragmitetus TaxID=121719 RepID=A0A378ZRA0_9HYPH|nr:DUF6492 family protein [Pannonibacter phragmitetus]SUA99786.1 Uncharacterised protein [Pannonibacter phragmitetus]